MGNVPPQSLPPHAPVRSLFKNGHLYDGHVTKIRVLRGPNRERGARRIARQRSREAYRAAEARGNSHLGGLQGADVQAPPRGWWFAYDVKYDDGDLEEYVTPDRMMLHSARTDPVPVAHIELGRVRIVSIGPGAQA